VLALNLNAFFPFFFFFAKNAAASAIMMMMMYIIVCIKVGTFGMVVCSCVNSSCYRLQERDEKARQSNVVG
jgi:hypothetical protein